jgi:hypothetical protein
LADKKKGKHHCLNSSNTFYYKRFGKEQPEVATKLKQ